MKKMLRALSLSLSLSLLATACGDSHEKEEEGGALQCHAVSWCSNMSVDDTEVTNAPALTGGTLPDGLYRLEQGLGARSTEAMLIKGSSFIHLEQVWDNTLGTWKVADGKLVMTRATSCDASGESSLESNQDVFTFAVRGDELFTRYDDVDQSVRRWKRVSDLCEASNSFKCRGSRPCSCISATNESLTGNQNCTL
ncbi:hypothetical protein HUA74_42395 [Myxococcus sp. CA051A]|uniref:hypothetical protein n=1 Tax=Myxococcus sp. CA051A TaxID=2741739 RepID=UPI00157A89F6|nr:hypothetical protein [Myxococcus sp. CA051A]NTX67321.1 hypothetical protein [Myxococcus sp. CA051A]